MPDPESTNPTSHEGQTSSGGGNVGSDSGQSESDGVGPDAGQPGPSTDLEPIDLVPHRRGAIEFPRIPIQREK